MNNVDCIHLDSVCGFVLLGVVVMVGQSGSCKATGLSTHFFLAINRLKVHAQRHAIGTGRLQEALVTRICGSGIDILHSVKVDNGFIEEIVGPKDDIKITPADSGSE
ncbi:MAG: hypothetical protein GY794_05885, partial [bacterium]|nr:hypothetical protein [bacterium]